MHNDAAKDLPGEELDLCCAKKKNCPKLLDEGAAGVVIRDTDQTPDALRMTPDEMDRATEWWIKRRAAQGITLG